MAKLGFTHAALCWGLDAAAWTLRVDDTRYALECCRRAGLGAYLVVWHPVHNSLPRRHEFQQVDVMGRLRFSFDTFNPKWRASQWKRYLQSVANLHAHEAAFAGYIFDDSFGIGPVSSISGPEGTSAERIISYGEDDLRRFGKARPRNYLTLFGPSGRLLAPDGGNIGHAIRIVLFERSTAIRTTKSTLKMASPCFQMRFEMLPAWILAESPSPSTP
jgi:hypothetical protein